MVQWSCSSLQVYIVKLRWTQEEAYRLKSQVHNLSYKLFSARAKRRSAICIDLGFDKYFVGLLSNQRKQRKSIATC